MYVLGRSLGLTPVYKCTSTICYGADGAGVGKGTDGLFRQLQTLINRFASVASFSPIGIDGKLGAGTVAALKRIGQWAAGRATANPNLRAYAVNIAAMSGTKEQVAATAQALVDTLTPLANLTNVGPRPDTPVQPVYVPPAPPVTLPSVAVPVPGQDGLPASDTAATSPFKKVPWPYYAAGGVAALGIVYAIYELTKPKASKPSAPVQGARRMTMSAFIRQNRKEIDAAIRRVCSNCRVSNDQDRREWIENDEGLHRWARAEGVRS